ncbi:hypothetical protein OG524_36170 [Streptomyces sp. NBC_01520]|uniref:hypothetical protein n=1 Tax=Streptomyces sp. NBC_01520 TaxID=2903892 RepID=UPI00386CFEA7
MKRKSSIRSLLAGKAGKAITIATLSLTALGIAVPSASASYESSWTYGCRGYWYSTSGHGYCSNVTNGGWFNAHYDCNAAEANHNQGDMLSYGYTGKFSEYECIFSINKTTVTR